MLGLLFVAGVYPLVMSVRSGWQANKEDALPMMLSLYVTLGIFLLVAARNPLASSVSYEPCRSDLHNTGATPLRCCALALSLSSRILSDH
jgi:hypothetical protein